MSGRSKLDVSPDVARQLAWVASLIAIEASETQAKYARSAQVDWRHIHELRAIMEAAGFDWRALKSRMAEIAKERGK